MNLGKIVFYQNVGSNGIGQSETREVNLTLGGISEI